MPSRENEPFPPLGTSEKKFSRKHFEDEQHDNTVLSNVNFEFCTFDKIGIKQAAFNHCVFRHCEFIDCYFVQARLEHCNFIGSSFERCNFTRAEFPSSQLDYTRFIGCAPVLQQVISQKPQDPQAAARFFRNLAIEHKNAGNWQEVDRLIKESYKERERHYWSVVAGVNDFYRSRYGGPRRFRYGLRFIGSKLNGIAWGYGVSWAAFGRSLAVLCFIVLPIVNMLAGHLRKPGAYFWSNHPANDAWRYIALIYRTTTQAFLPFIPSSLIGPTDDLVLPFVLVVAETLLGTVFIGLFVSLLFRASAKGA